MKIPKETKDFQRGPNAAGDGLTSGVARWKPIAEPEVTFKAVAGASELFTSRSRTVRQQHGGLATSPWGGWCANHWRFRLSLYTRSYIIIIIDLTKVAVWGILQRTQLAVERDDLRAVRDNMRLGWSSQSMKGYLRVRYFVYSLVFLVFEVTGRVGIVNRLVRLFGGVAIFLKHIF